MSSNKGLAHVALLVFALLVIGAGIATYFEVREGFFIRSKDNVAPEEAEIPETPNTDLEVTTQVEDEATDSTEDIEIEEPVWSVYRNDDFGIEFAKPEGILPFEENNEKISLGWEIDKGNDLVEMFPYLQIFKGYDTALNSLHDCMDNPDIDEARKLSEETISTYFPCLITWDTWGQEEDVLEFELAGVGVRSFYIAEGYMNGDYHIIQTLEEPRIEMKMYISGGGLEENFERMYSTLKFLE